MTETVNEFAVEDLEVVVLGSEAELGHEAAKRASMAIRAAVASRGSARIVLATGNSQFAFTAALRSEDIPWNQVTVFHMDEYVAIAADHPASFRRWMRERVEEPFGVRVEYITGDATDITEECERYERLLRAAPLDLVCMGIGENGHLAFNEPGQADFADERWVCAIDLLPASIAQQVGEGHFPSREAVPKQAISLTIPALLSARQVQVCVPEARKAAAVAATLRDPISIDCPATILRVTEQATLFLEPASFTQYAGGNAAHQPTA